MVHATPGSCAKSQDVVTRQLWLQVAAAEQQWKASQEAVCGPATCMLQSKGLDMLETYHSCSSGAVCRENLVTA